ncbi:hypothetical protein [Methylobacter sp.]|uniref:hypothetical protein n=1 Tax=Methylobacter sp. TaxID=2051955 RepID=UPI002619F5EE|nr:hypothetical protein [Methylobacter sp.]
MPQDKKTLIESSGKAARRIRREAICQSPKVGALVDAQRQLQAVAVADEPFDYAVHGFSATAPALLYLLHQCSRGSRHSLPG